MAEEQAKGKEYIAVYNGKSAVHRTEGGGVIGDGDSVFDHWEYCENSERLYAPSDDEAIKLAMGKTNENKHLIRLSRLEDLMLFGGAKT